MYRVAVWFLVGLFFTSLHSGCSLIGFGIGSYIDASDQDTTLIMQWSEWDFTENDSVSLLMKDGSRFDGIFLRPSLLPDSSYERYYLTVVPEEIALPRLYDSLTVRIAQDGLPERTVAGEFIGFSIDQVRRRSMIRLRGNPRTVWLALPDIESLQDKSGTRYRGDALDSLVNREQVGINYGLIVSSSASDTLFPVNEIQSLVVSTEPRAKWTGMAIGGVVDVGVLVWMITSRPFSISTPLFKE